MIPHRSIKIISGSNFTNGNQTVFMDPISSITRATLELCPSPVNGISRGPIRSGRTFALPWAYIETTRIA
jgi:hypothetical protein